MYEALHIGLISSDESDTEGDALTTRPLPWRADTVNEYFRLFDECWKAGMTSQEKRQSVDWSPSIFALGRACWLRDSMILFKGLMQNWW